MTATAQIDIGMAGLRASPPQPLPFAPSLHVRAFVLEREQGDVLVYSTETIEDAGGVSRWYLNHRHEAMFLPASLPAPLFVHEDDRQPVAAKARVRAAFSRRFTLDDDFEAIPTPGHTPGATAYLWDSGEHRFLFTGDTIYLDEGEWVAALLDSSDRAAYLDSLALLRDLQFDVLVPWAATAGQPYHAVTSQADARRRIDTIIERVLDGHDR
jgi:glyoxylase-like metal-dependent hydrolase (beta-lactamase superfamily II)